MNIAIIGIGMIGGTLAHLLVKAGHHVMLSARDTMKCKALAASLGPSASAANPRDAVNPADLVIVSVPLRAMPDVAKTLSVAAHGKVIVDTSNPYPNRDGELADEATKRGTGSGSWAASLFPGAKVVKAFNTLYFEALAVLGDTAAPIIAIPIASDEPDALKLTAGLIKQLGFVPVALATMADSRCFDAGTPAYGQPHDEAELRQLLQAVR
jgi:8-hydroxy-5-deazaflavin:NADPH oxidoreductase